MCGVIIPCFTQRQLCCKHTERQEARQAPAAGPHRLVLATDLDAPNRPQTHYQIMPLTLTLPLTRRLTLVVFIPLPVDPVVFPEALLLHQVKVSCHDDGVGLKNVEFK